MSSITVILVVYFVVVGVRGVVLLVLAGKASLNAFVHGRAFEALLWHLPLVVQSLVRELLLSLVRLILCWTTYVACLKSARAALLLRPHVEVALSAPGCLVAMAIRRVNCVIRWPHVVLLAEAFHLCKDSEAALRRNETRNDLLCDVLCRSSKQVFELDRAELLDDRALLADALLKALFELVELSFFFVEVLDEPPPSLRHFV